MQNKDIRWKQRFQNFEKSVGHLKDALDITEPDIIQRAGLIQFFEMSFELAWNTLKDMLNEQGFTDIKSPRDTIKKAFEIELIEDGHTWLQALENRNLTSHTYDEETAAEVVQLIRTQYYPLLEKLQNTLNLIP
ncbi:MAG: nucleotidyltransferase substrate binding protein [Bacteroidales bacterium]|nr:nucleotidyltransferase substrate binding protein [Bacteroidales bacterium]